MNGLWKRCGAAVTAAALVGGMLLGGAGAAALPYEDEGPLTVAGIRDEIDTELGKDPSQGKDDATEHQEDYDFLEGQFDFDPATGTLRKATVSEMGYLEIPEEINGVPVRRIAPYAIQGQPVVGVYFPINVELIDSVVVADCPELLIVSIAPTTKVTARVYENCPQLGKDRPIDYGGTPYFEQELFQPISITGGMSGQKINLPQALMKKLEVFQGNGSSMNWKGTLTRVEAVTILVRLLGQEEEAKAASGEPSAFSDVPQWAVGYVNLAYRQGMVKGVGAGRFNPNGLCGSQEFSLMLLRLTDHREGTDYGWNTAIRDLQKLVEAARETGWKTQLQMGDDRLFYFLYNEPLTREMACALLYRALAVPMADEKTSLADMLCAEHGLSTAAMADCEMRLTPAALGDRLNGKTYHSALLASLMVAMDDEAKWAVSQANREKPVSPQIQELTDRVTAGCSTDKEKAKAICVWIAENIVYDGDDLSDGTINLPQDADSVLERGTAVCDGYSWLTNAMMKAADIPCVRLVCWAGGVKHASNEVYAGGRWFPVDTTWMSGSAYNNGTEKWDEIEMRWFDMDYPTFYDSHDLLMRDRRPGGTLFW